MRNYQTANDLTIYRTDDPAANYETKQNDEIKRQKEIIGKKLKRR